MIFCNDQYLWAFPSTPFAPTCYLMLKKVWCGRWPGQMVQILNRDWEVVPWNPSMSCSNLLPKLGKVCGDWEKENRTVISASFWQVIARACYCFANHCCASRSGWWRYWPGIRPSATVSANIPQGQNLLCDRCAACVLSFLSCSLVFVRTVWGLLWFYTFWRQNYSML